MSKNNTKSKIPGTDTKKKLKDLNNKIRELNQQNAQLKAIMNDLPGDIYWKNKAGVWVGLNKHCAQSLQRMGFIRKADENEVLGKTDYEIFGQETANEYRKHDLEVMNHRTELSVEENTLLPSGEKVILHSKKNRFLMKKERL